MRAADRARIVAVARRWIGTPYLHQASTLGAGADCLGLVRGVWREVIGPEPEALPGYAPDWAELTGAETLLEAAQRHFVGVPIGQAAYGDVILFRMHSKSPVKHCAILAAPDSIIHAYHGHSVCETPLGPWWRRRMVAAGRFPLASEFS